MLFFAHEYNSSQIHHSTIEIFITADPPSAAHPVYSMRGIGRRMLYDVKPEHLIPGRYWVHARSVGQDDRIINSTFFSSATR